MRVVRTVVVALGALLAIALLCLAVLLSGDASSSSESHLASLNLPLLGHAPDRPLAASAEPPPSEGQVTQAAPRIERRPVAKAPPPSADIRSMAAPPPPVDPEQAVRGTLRLAQTAFEACYEDSLRRDQRVKGKVTIQLSIAATGIVMASKITESTISDERALACITTRLKQLKFPKLGEEIEVSIPLTLVPRAL